jgi:uncharacterized membrane protein
MLQGSYYSGGGTQCGWRVDLTNCALIDSWSCLISLVDMACAFDRHVQRVHALLGMLDHVLHL